MTWHRGEYTISADPHRLDLGVIHSFLARSYWSPGIPLETVRVAVENSMPFGVFHGETQVGFARLITDRASFAYLADVFVLEEHRGKGLATWLAEVIVGHPELQGLRRWMLATADAHGLYAKVGFVPLAAPERWMERHFPARYAAPAAGSP
jgi:GNAT superfamily N-acetyltransferase